MSSLEICLFLVVTLFLSNNVNRSNPKIFGTFFYLHGWSKLIGKTHGNGNGNFVKIKNNLNKKKILKCNYRCSITFSQFVHLNLLHCMKISRSFLFAVFLGQNCISQHFNFVVQAKLRISWYFNFAVRAKI